MNRWIDDLLDLHERPLLLYATRLVGDAEGARDIVQETFLKLCRQSPSRLKGHEVEWLYTVCRNAALDLQRRERTMERTRETIADVTETSTESTAAAVVHGEEQARIVALLDRLPERQREAIRLKFQGGLSYKEIASVTGESIGNVGYLIHIGMRWLREEMRPETKEGSVA